MNKQIGYLLVICGLMLWSGYQLIPAWTEYQDTRRELAALDERLLDAQARNEQLRADIHHLRTDDRAVERVAREKFGWALPNETIYDFSGSTATP
jgi:cell division protein FtsB